MKIMVCPLSGPRNISEFTYGGECHEMPDPSGCSPSEWVEYVFFPDNKAGVVLEWWLHTATSYWFLAERNTITNRIIRTFPASEVFSERMEFTIKATSNENKESRS